MWAAVGRVNVPATRYVMAVFVIADVERGVVLANVANQNSIRVQRRPRDEDTPSVSVAAIT